MAIALSPNLVQQKNLGTDKFDNAPSLQLVLKTKYQSNYTQERT
ncbi:hypothetical protein NIES23_28010 [Trichormus variabilis NIES-23]|uniref:Uncharacterized protein n=1 Tax=Trichormus variabilis NIES-23 TaxID=1973479 RepID=A0A1Z4KLY1_ANAVA|nr:hypothetical protein NIES23_28010 [Trichormus variabilis NIES-23]